MEGKELVEGVYTDQYLQNWKMQKNEEQYYVFTV